MIPSVGSLTPQYIASSSYIFIFILMVVEGPIVTYIAAFASSLGLLNIYIIFLLASLGNIMGDIILYYIGKFGKQGIIEKYFKKRRLKKSLIKKIEYSLKNHTGKTLAFVKTVPPFAVPSLIMAGIVDVPIEKFLLYSIPVSALSGLVFSVLGFYTGEAYKNFAIYFKRVELAVSATLVLVFIGWLVFRYIENKVKKVETKSFKVHGKLLKNN